MVVVVGGVPIMDANSHHSSFVDRCLGDTKIILRVQGEK
jgi:hypothetical protein